MTKTIVAALLLCFTAIATQSVSSGVAHAVGPVATFFPSYAGGVCRVYTYYWNSGNSIPTLMEGLSVQECYQEAAGLNAAQLMLQ